MSEPENERSLRKRWLSDEGRAREVLALLQENRLSNLLSLVGQHDGRCDLRGFAFPTPVPRGASVHVGRTEFEVIEKRVEYSNLSIRRFDFSHASLAETSWSNCVFDDCQWNDAVLTGAQFWACEIVNSSFRGCDLRGSLLAGHIGRNGGRIANVTVTNGRFSEVCFAFPEIADTSFDCDITNVNFDGSRLAGCKFSGKLDKVTFRRRSGVVGGTLSRTVLPNKMENVDFSKANLDDVDFRGGVPLTSCKFPERPCYFLVLDGPRVFREVKRELESAWDGEDRRIALGFTVNYFIDRAKEGQKHFLIDEDSFSEYWGRSLAHRYSSLIEGTAEALSALNKLSCQDGR